MRQMKQGIYLFVLVMATSSGAWAGSFEDSQANLAKAYNDFYKALQNSSNPSQEVNQLSQQIIGPASRQVTQAMKDTTVQTLQKIRANERNSTPIALKIPPGYDPKKDKSLGSVSGAQAIPQNAPAPVQPKTVLDGSQVPRELDFSGPSKPAAE